MNKQKIMQVSTSKKLNTKINIAKDISGEKIPFFDKLRKCWELIAFRSTIGNWSIKILLAVVVFISLHASVQYGRTHNTSILSDLLLLLPVSIPQTGLTFLAFELVLSVLWLFLPAFATFLCAILEYLCFAAISPMVLLLVFILLILFQMEDRPVVALAIAMPVLTLITPVRIGIFVAILMAFISTRKNNGTVRSLSFLYIALLELCNGSFGMIRNSLGTRVIPSLNTDIHALTRIKTIWNTLYNGGSTQHYLSLIWMILGVFYLLGFVFSRELVLKDKMKKLNIELRDGILFLVLMALFITAIILMKRFEIISLFSYSYFSVVLQFLLAYIVTRPIAGNSPMRGEQVYRQDKNYIFISYAHADIAMIKPYLSILSKRGYDFWYDDNIRAGTEWQGVIADNLAMCSCFLAFVSKTSVTSDYCLTEISYASTQKKPMAVIQIEETTLPPVLQMLFASLQIVQRWKFESDEACLDKVLDMEDFNCCRN